MKILSHWKLAALLSIVFAGTVQAGGCTGREIASGVGAALVVDALHRSSPPPPVYVRDCRPVRRTFCQPVSTYGRRHVESCTTGMWDPCYGGWRRASVGTTTSEQLNVADLMSNYRLQESGAQKLIDALVTAEKATDAETAQIALKTICLDVDEVKSIKQSGGLSASTIDCMAKSLDQDPELTVAMVTKIAETARAQEAARQQYEEMNRN
jgi:hypothetical protein